MVYACRICEYDEIGENKCVYRNDLLTVTKYVLRSFALLSLSMYFFARREQKGVTTDLGTDPTLVCSIHIQYREPCSQTSFYCDRLTRTCPAQIAETQSAYPSP